ncbi:hypothetical protein [Foetidibacter luteolus]|uniref:hypothetical protein n=1 Tax=Foetidibacter luteolus TaxID=2608880 RepID=UPI00129A39FE|nr:hypothetical protein [Foetidibacter luteolus]
MFNLNSAITRRQAFSLIILLFLVSVLLRVPNLGRPLAKHHEFLSAVVLMNTTSWEQAGGGGQFHFTPLMNYQNPGDKQCGKSVNTDMYGNTLYLSLGPAWYIIPYFLYSTLHLPVIPLYLRLLNLCFGLVSLITCFLFFEQLVPQETKRKYHVVIAGCLLFLFAPALLWYSGNGYTHTAIMLPFVFATLLMLLPMLKDASNITGGRLAGIFLLVFALLYVDWFAVFIGGCSAIVCLTKARQQKKYFLLAAVLLLALVAGIAAIFWQFSSYAGSETVIGYWKSRFLERSITTKKVTLPVMLFSVCKHYITSFLPVIGAIVILHLVNLGKGIRVVFSKTEKLLLFMFAISLLLYNIVLLHWSHEHEFSIVPAGILIAYVAAKYVVVNRRYRLVMATIIGLCICQYYIINPSGEISLTGMRYDIFKRFGGQVKTIDPDYKIFVQKTEIFPISEYYAGRNFVYLRDTAAVKDSMRSCHITKALWVEQQGFKLKKMVWLTQ